MKERKTGGKLKTALIAIIMLAIGIFMGFGIVFYFQETKPATGHAETEPSSEEVYQYALEYLKHANEDAAEPEAIEYSAYSSDAVGRFPATEELSNEDEYVPCDYAKNAQTITHRMYTVNITMTYAGQAHKVKVFEYVSEGYSPLHHHGCLNEDGKTQVSALKTTDSSSQKGKENSEPEKETVPYSMDQKYAKLKSNDRDTIENASKEYLYGDWYKDSDKDKAIKITEYEIDGRGYGISYSGEAMRHEDSGNIVVDFTFYYLDAPKTDRTLSLMYMKEIGVYYLYIGNTEYTDVDQEVIAQKEQEFDRQHNFNVSEWQDSSQVYQGGQSNVESNTLQYDESSLYSMAMSAIESYLRKIWNVSGISQMGTCQRKSITNCGQGFDIGGAYDILCVYMSFKDIGVSGEWTDGEFEVIIHYQNGYSYVESVNGMEI